MIQRKCCFHTSTPPYNNLMTFSREGFDHGQFFAASGSGSVSQQLALSQGRLTVAADGHPRIEQTTVVRSTRESATSCAVRSLIARTNKSVLNALDDALDLVAACPTKESVASTKLSIDRGRL
jgi:hypothetical protein